MAITIKRSLRKGIEAVYPLQLQTIQNNPYSVPDLYDDMLNTFNKKKMPLSNFAKPIISCLQG